MKNSIKKKDFSIDEYFDNIKMELTKKGWN